MARIFGKVWLLDGKWHMEGEPHLLIRAKRIFARIWAAEHGVVTLKNTDEICRDIEWFIDRYPMELSPGDKRILERGSKRHIETMATLDQLIDQNYTGREFKMGLPPRDYQKLAASILLERGFLLLADELGTGKTVSALAALTDKRTLPAIVVTLTGTMPMQWQSMTWRFMPSLTTHVINKGTPYELPKIKARGPDVVIVNYHKLTGWAETLAAYGKSIIFDECLRGSTRISLYPGEHEKLLTDIQPGDLISSFDETGNVVPDKVTGKTYKGKREIWRLTLEDGRYLEGTSNERLWTNLGWLYLKDIIDASRCENEKNPVGSIERVHSAGCSGNLTGRRLFDMAARQPIPTLEDEAWYSAGSVLPSQSKDLERLHKDISEDRGESRLGKEVRGLCNRDYAGLRVFGLDVLQEEKERVPNQDCYSSVDSRTRLASDCLLVHGRRVHPKEEWNRDVCHALVHEERSEGTCGSSVENGDRSGSRQNVERGTLVLDDSAPDGRVSQFHSKDSLLCSEMHGLQAEASKVIAKNLQGVQESSPWSKKQESIMVQSYGMHQKSSSLISLRIAKIERVGYDDVWDIETERHHTFFANGIAVHNCQELRRAGSKKYEGAVHIARQMRFRLGCSATPIFNLGGEIWNVVNVLQEDALGTWQEFLREWCYGERSYDGKAPAVRDPKALGSYLRSEHIMLRRTRKDIGRELPPCTKIPQYIDSDESALDSVKDSAKELAKIIMSNEKVAGWDRMKAAEEFSQVMRQATGIAKAPYVADFIRMIVDGDDEPVLVFAWHRAVYDILMAKLNDLAPSMYTGTESAGKKQEAIDRFVKGETKVLLMSLRSGVGLDGLQHMCRTVIFAELDWTPGVHDQCVGRVFRDGQKEPVTAVFLVAERGADPVMAETLGLKTAQLEGIRDPDKPLVEQKPNVDHIRKLAQRYLEKAGKKQTIEFPKEEEPEHDEEDEESEEEESDVEVNEDA